ncbi:MAG: NAAT family transporter [Lentisphaeria bacterium]|nr:NAAT family transporter [Lentisphaeria bacterium]
MSLFLNQFLKFFFLMTPFFVLSMYLSMTQDWETKQKRKLALNVGASAFVVCTILLFFGRYIFSAFGITLDAFRIGGGALLFLTSVGLVNSNVTDKKPSTQTIDPNSGISSIAVVPLAIPVTIGPGTTGAMLVIGAESTSWQFQIITLGGVALALAVLTIMLAAASWLEEKLGRNTILILSKLTGLVLAAMASQMVFTGIRSFLVVTK